MDFIKENWSKILLSVVGLVGLIFIVLSFIGGPLVDLGTGFETYTDAVVMSKTYMLVAQTLFFGAVLVYPILRMFDVTKKASVYALLSVGVISLVMVILSMTSASGYLTAAQDAINAGRVLHEGNEVALAALDIKQWTLTSSQNTTIVNMLIFALAPIIFAVKKLVSFKEA